MAVPANNNLTPYLSRSVLPYVHSNQVLKHVALRPQKRGGLLQTGTGGGGGGGGGENERMSGLTAEDHRQNNN